MIRQGYQTVSNIINKGVKRRKIPVFKAPMMMDQVTSSLTYDGFKSMDLIMEAVPEKWILKKCIG